LAKTYKQLQNLIVMNWGDSTIAAKAFGSREMNDCGTSLVKVIIHKATMIGDEAFRFCTNLTTISFPDVTDIGTANGGSDAFGGTNLTTVFFPVAKIVGRAAFWFCVELVTVSFPAAISIDDASFNQCNALVTAYFPVGSVEFYQDSKK
jgi:hypothetical protein